MNQPATRQVVPAFTLPVAHRWSRLGAEVLGASGMTDWRLLDSAICAGLCAIAVLIGFAATVSGPGATADSATYISMADNLLRGRGFVSDIAGPFDSQDVSPVTLWPPGYSLLIALFMVPGLKALEAAQWAGLISFAAMIACTYVLARMLGGRYLAGLASVGTVVLMPVVRTATFALSDMPFTAFSVFAVVGITRFALARRDSELAKWLAVTTVATALAILIRYVGAVWIGTGLVIIALRPGLGLKRKVVSAAILAALSILPVVPWLVRNQNLVGKLSGLDRGAGYHASLLENVRFLAWTLSRDLLPAYHLGVAGTIRTLPPHVWIGLAILVGATLLGVLRGGFGLPHKLSMPRLIGKLSITRGPELVQFIPLGYLGTYVLALLGVSTVSLFPPYDWPRYLAPTYPFGLILLAQLLFACGRWLARWTSSGLGLLLLVVASILWVTPYALQTRGFVGAAAQGQEYSLPAWRENEGIRYLAGLLSSGDRVFSNRPEAVYILLSRPSRHLPRFGDTQQLLALIHSGGRDEAVHDYIVVFEGGLSAVDPYQASRASAAEVEAASRANPGLTLAAKFPDVSIYRAGHVAR